MKFSLSFALLALPLLATAGPLAERSTPAGSCNGGSTLQCCNDLRNDHNSPDVVSMLGPLNILLKDIDVPIGIKCSPLTIIGLANTCTQKTACCSGNTYNGLVTVGCNSI